MTTQKSQSTDVNDRDLFKMRRTRLEHIMQVASTFITQSEEDVEVVKTVSEQVYRLQWRMSDYKRLPFLDEKYWFDYIGNPDRPCVEEAAAGKQIEFLQLSYHQADPIYQWTLMSYINKVEQQLAQWILDRQMRAAASQVYLNFRKETK